MSFFVGVDVLGKYNPLFFGKRLGVDDMSDKGPRTAFHWREILSFWEFKLEGTWRRQSPSAILRMIE
jgi:hypothetical protein